MKGRAIAIIQKASGSANDRIFLKETPATQYDSFYISGMGLVGDRAAQPAEVPGA